MTRKSVAPTSKRMRRGLESWYHSKMEGIDICGHTLSLGIIVQIHHVAYLIRSSQRRAEIRGSVSAGNNGFKYMSF